MNFIGWILSIFFPVPEYKYNLSERSLKNLKGVHPDLRKVVYEAIKITDQDFVVIEGLRSKKRQEELVANGFSKTMNSRHITGHAVDIVPYPIPGDWAKYTHGQWVKISLAMKQSAKEQDIPLEWGGDWRSFVDKPHYQLPRNKYA